MHFGRGHVTIFLFPVVKGVLADAVVAGDILDQFAFTLLGKDSDNLLFGKNAFSLEASCSLNRSKTTKACGTILGVGVKPTSVGIYQQ
jgi:hypothetical protein